MSTQNISRVEQARRRHKRQRTWQIWVPFGAFGLLVLAAMVFSVFLAAGGGGVSEWADVSLIVLILPGLLCSFGLMVLTGGLAGLTIIVNRKLPVLTGKIHSALGRVQQIAESISQKAASPFIKVASLKAGLIRLRNLIFG
jgi:hypothetical protein